MPDEQKNIENELPVQPESKKIQETEFPALNKDKIEFYSSLKKAVWATFGSILLLIVTQLMTNCSNQSLENKKRESELIKQALAPGNQQQSEQNLIFLVRAKLIDCKQFDKKPIQEYLNLNAIKSFFNPGKNTTNNDDTIYVNEEDFNNYYVPKGNKDGKKITFTPEEKKCRIIKSLLTATPQSFGNNSSPSNSSLSPNSSSNPLPLSSPSPSPAFSPNPLPPTPPNPLPSSNPSPLPNIPDFPSSNQSKYDQATFLQNQGFRYLLEGNVPNAKSSFQAAFNIYPTLYNIDEINKLLDQVLDQKFVQKDELEIPAIYCQIVSKYSWGMPNEIKVQMKQKGNCK
jgi:hypothetical protein